MFTSACAILDFGQGSCICIVINYTRYIKLLFQIILQGKVIPPMGMMEGAYVRLLLTREQEPGMAVRVLQSEHGATVAWAILAPDAHWFSDVWTLDLHAHPSFAAGLPTLLGSLPWPAAPVASAVTDPAGPKAAALAAGGFTRIARLPAWLRPDDGARRDVSLWIRS